MVAKVLYGIDRLVDQRSLADNKIAAPRERCKQIEGARIEWETCEENKWQVVAGMVGAAGIALAYKAEQRQLDQRQKLGKSKQGDKSTVVIQQDKAVANGRPSSGSITRQVRTRRPCPWRARLRQAKVKRERSVEEKGKTKMVLVTW